MRADRRSITVAFLLVSVGCASNPAPRGWLPRAVRGQADPYGAWIVISRLPGQASLSGEFLAVDTDSLFFLPMDGAVRSIPLDSVRQATIAFYDAQLGGMTAWVTLGSISTVSHGVGLVLSLPTWVIAGSIATSVESRAPLRNIQRKDQWNAARMYARFPAGLPPHLPRTLPPKWMP